MCRDGLPRLPTQVPNMRLGLLDKAHIKIPKDHNLVSFHNPKEPVRKALPPARSVGIRGCRGMADYNEELKVASLAAHDKIPGRPGQDPEVLSLKIQRLAVSIREGHCAGNP